MALETKFAPAERDSEKQVSGQTGVVEAMPLVREIFNGVSNILAILNSRRQIVFANRALYSFLGVTNPREILGKRPGEALKCSHADESEGGCGTTESCRMCGMANAIVSAQQDAVSVQECRILRDDDCPALDLRIQASPIEIKGTSFTVLSIQDIADEKRRKVLERSFYGGLLHTARDLKDDAEKMDLQDLEGLELRRNDIHMQSEKLIADINGQRLLAAAESGELTLRPSQFGLMKLINEVTDGFQERAHSANVNLRIDPDSEDTQFVSERTLLKLVVTHLLTNAMEACERAGDVVTIGCSIGRNMVELRIHNPGQIPEDDALQVFQRSFTTKGEGRGIGTYAAKFFAERYLNGRISFTSSQAGGTTFRIECPRNLDS